MRKAYCLCKKKDQRICDESSSKSVKVVANIHVSLQFCDKAALERYITLSNTERARKNNFVPFFHQKILIVGLIVKFYKPFSQ